MTESTFP